MTNENVENSKCRCGGFETGDLCLCTSSKSNKQDDADLGTFRKEDGVDKKLDYVAVCVFVYFALDANIGTDQLTTALQGRKRGGDDGNVCVLDQTKANLAKMLVDKFLCRD